MQLIMEIMYVRDVGMILYMVGPKWQQWSKLQEDNFHFYSIYFSINISSIFYLLDDWSL